MYSRRIFLKFPACQLAVVCLMIFFVTLMHMKPYHTTPDQENVYRHGMQNQEGKGLATTRYTLEDLVGMSDGEMKINNLEQEHNAKTIIDTEKPETYESPVMGIPVMDFETYPCLTDINTSEELRDIGQCVRTVNITLASQTVSDNHCVHLQLSKPTPICIHDPREDRVVSGLVFSTGMWEGKQVKSFVDALHSVPDISVLDIGCNIGVYTVAAARSGKRVVAVDANIENLRLLSKTLILGRLSETVTLIWNAMSNEHTDVFLTPARMNVGGYFIDPKKKATGSDVIIHSITLNDLESLFHDRPVAIKLDVELFELRVLRGGLVFLENVNVKFIQVEMRHHRRRKSGALIVAFLEPFGFKPYLNCLRDGNLEHVNVEEYPYDVCFVR